MLDYRLIEALSMVVKEGGFEKAAKALHLTQSAVSQRVRQLEERTGQVLLSRTTPPRPSGAGRQLIKHYRQVKLLEDSLTVHLNKQGQEGPTTLAIGVNADSLSTWFLAAVGPLLESGELLFDLRVDDQEQTHKLLKDGEVVGCVSTEAKAMPGCRIEPLGGMTYRLLATPDFIQRWFPSGLTLSECTKAPALIFNPKDNLHNLFLQQALGRLPEIIPTHYVPSPEQFPALIAAGYAYGMVPDCQSELLRQSGQLIELAPGEVTIVNLYWHCWNLNSPVLDKLTHQLVVRGPELLK